MLFNIIQPTDDIVLMAQSLEKAFLQKVAQMPQDELELPPPPPRMKSGKPGKKGRGNLKLALVMLAVTHILHL